jgi:hypothetical protein
MEEFQAIQFICEPISVHFDIEPALQKKPGCPTSFTWRDKTYPIVELLGEWKDYHRRGDMLHNMSTEHATSATRRGSWGVGVYYFRIMTQDERIFDIYFDRAPDNVDDRKGKWFLYRELIYSKGAQE